MQCKELEAVLEQEGLSPLPIEAREHLAECTACQNYLADLSAIVVAAKQFPMEAAPPDRIWISLRAQLKADGVITSENPVAVQEPSAWWQGISTFLRPRALALVGTSVLLVAGSYYMVKHSGRAPVANVQKPAVTQQAAKPVAPLPQNKPAESVVAKQDDQLPANQISAKNGPAKPEDSTLVLKPSPSENAFGDSAIVLSQTESDVQNMQSAGSLRVDAALRQNLRTLNEFIAECEQHLKQHPQDQLAREYLNSAYQQKAELLAAMIDSGRSEH